MKILSKKKLFTFLLLTVGALSYAPPPPPPPPPGEELPINENIYLLVIIALIFGIHIIYNKSQNKKAPM